MEEEYRETLQDILDEFAEKISKDRLLLTKEQLADILRETVERAFDSRLYFESLMFDKWWDAKE